MSDQNISNEPPAFPDSAQIAANKALLRTVIEQYWTSAEGLEELVQYIAPNYVHHTPFGDLTFDQFCYGLGVIRTFSPVLRYSVTHVIAEGDLYVVHLRSVMTHTGAVDDIAPTGKVIECTGAYHCRIVDRKIVEDWDVWTILPVFQQLIARLQS